MEQKLITFINEELLDETGDGGIGLEDELLLDGYIDSLGVMRLVSFIEAELGFRMPPRDVSVQNLRSVAVLAEYLRAQGAAST